MSLDIKQELDKLVSEHWVKFKTAPTKGSWVYGVKVDSKYDVQKAFTQNLKEIKNIAQLIAREDVARSIEPVVKQAEADLETLDNEDNPYIMEGLE